MSPFFNFIKKNRFSAMMLLAIIIFYFLIFFQGTQVYKKSHFSSSVEAQSFEMKPEEMKKKEDLFEKKISERPGLILAGSCFLVIALLAGLILDARILWDSKHGRRWVEGALPHEIVAWNETHLVQVVIFMFFFEAALLLFETFFYASKSAHEIPRDFLLMANSLLRDTAAAVFILVLVKKLGNQISSLGLTTHHFFKNVFRGVAGYLAALPLLLLTLLLVSVIANQFSYEPPPQNVVQIYLKKSSDPYLLFFTIFVAGLGPMLEEIFFRGFAYKAFRQRFGAMAAMMLTSAIFAAFHMNLAAFLPIFILGMMLCWLYEETGSLVPSMTAHVIHNLIMVNFALGFKSIVGS